MARSIPPPVVEAAPTRAVTEAIAKDTDTDPEIVEEIYRQELSNLANDAKITQFIGVIANRRVRMMLRKH